MSEIEVVSNLTPLDSAMVDLGVNTDLINTRGEDDEGACDGDQ